MFKRNKKEDKSKLEHKLYLARENPEPIFDLSDCGLKNVPSGTYSLCHVFLKESLHLEHNQLSSLSGGGNLKDLSLLKVLNLQDNNFSVIPNEIEYLINVIELYLNDNHIKKLPMTICKLKKLQILDVSNNLLKLLPEDIGYLVNLRKLNIFGNTSISVLPKSICYAQRLREIRVNSLNFKYPPAEIVEKDTEAIMQFICNDNNFSYVPPESLQDSSEDVNTTEDRYQANVRTLEKIKEQKVQDFLVFERNNELLQRQQFELASAMKSNRERLLVHLSEQQSRLKSEFKKIQLIKESERFRLIEQLIEAEQNADIAINQLLDMNREPLIQLLEREKLEEENILAATRKYNETFCKTDILNAMQDLLKQETLKFTRYDNNRTEIARSILEQEAQSDTHLLGVLQNYGNQKSDLTLQIQEDVELQKAAVGALLERKDARSWSLIQQICLVQSQLAALTMIELDRQKLEMDERLNDLVQKRMQLSSLLLELFHQQEQRRNRLLLTIKTMEQEENNREDFWLQQYQHLLEGMPSSVTEAQNNIDPALLQALLTSGALHCLPFLARLIQTNGDVIDVTEDNLKEAGVTNNEDKRKILEAFHIYSKQRDDQTMEVNPSAPLLEEASAPVTESTAETTNATECVVCMDNNCQIIFVPCGHLCCCINCSIELLNCPMCRITIEQKMRIYIN